MRGNSFASSCGELAGEALRSTAFWPSSCHVPFNEPLSSVLMVTLSNVS